MACEPSLEAKNPQAPRVNCLHALVLDQADRTPDRVAVRARDGALTYRELASRARSLARQLRFSGVETETPVGVLLPRLRNLPVGLLAVMASGGAYVPLDPAHPDERMGFLLQDCQAPVVVTTATLAGRLAGSSARAITIDSLDTSFDGKAGAALEEHSGPDRLAYIIYTSGSTGRPKGVMIEHRNAAALLAWAHQEYSETELSRVVAATSITFDLSVFEIFAPLSCGGSIDIIDDGLAFAHWPDRIHATLLNTVPSIMREIIELDALPPKLPVVNLAGEALPRGLVEAIWRRCPQCRVYNLYGPSEDTTYSTGGIVLPTDACPTIGRPLTGRQVYVLNEQGVPVGEGDIGQIYVGGPGVARGYWRHPELTEQAFVPDIGSNAGRSMYRTGDYARVLPDGRLLFLGRKDDQIKLRGYRVHLSEIDAAVRAHSGVAEAATVAVDDERRGTFLRCAVRLRDGTCLSQVQNWVAERLPGYMAQLDWIELEVLPRLPNGKVDRTALRVGFLSGPRRGNAPPEGAVETRLARLWSDLLGLTPIFREDTFVALGGHSLLAARLSARIRESFGVDIPGSRLLRFPTLRAQAELLGSAGLDENAPIPEFNKPNGPAPCSFAQQRMWILDRLLPGSSRYNIPLAFRLSGPVNVEALSSALQCLLDRHPVLRTTYNEEAGELRQTVCFPPGDLLSRADVSQQDCSAAWSAALRLATSFVRRAFDLAREPPFRALLIEVTAHERLLVLSTHHIAVDGSVDLLIDELSHAYADALARSSRESTGTRRTYIDYAVWETGRVSVEGALAPALTYWSSRLADPPPPLNVPSDRARTGPTRGLGARYSCRLSRALFDQLYALIRARDVSLFQTLLALTWAFLSRLCDQEDLCVAAPLADRPHPALQGVVGNFVNTVILRGSLGGDPGFQAILDQARQRTIEAIEHGSFPFDKIVEAIPGSRHAEGVPFANIMVSLQQHETNLKLEGVYGEPIDLALETTRFELGFLFRLVDGGLELSVEYDSGRFERSTVCRYVGHWLTLAQAALSDPSVPLSRLPLLTSIERASILERWNDTAAGYDRTRSIHSFFEQRVRLDPGALALTAPNVTLTYGELNDHADRLARAIRAIARRPGAKIGIFCDRSPSLIVGMLAVLKAGCAYVPLDPDIPPARLCMMLQIAEVAVVVTEASLGARAAALCTANGTDIPSLIVGGEYGEMPNDMDPILPTDVSSEALAYVIFTSGTTGVPKAVAVRHRPVANLIEWVNNTHGVGPNDRLLFVTSVAFDLSVYDVFGILAAGASIRIASRTDIKDPSKLATILQCEPITFWNSAPIVLDQCVPYLRAATPGALRLVFLSGDWIPVGLPGRLRAIVPPVEVIALGGATEAVVWSNFHRVKEIRRGQNSIPYGRPIQNARYHILDRNLEPVPIGVPGDLYIGGEVLADGYFGDAELTAERFIRDPFHAQPGARLYRTGDRARYGEDGVIEFLGRLDTQAKIRGHRVEASEVEAVLAAQVGIRSALVTIEGDRSDRWLCGYVVPNSAAPGLVTALRSALRACLPEYMVPAAIVVLDEFPLTRNGKIDRVRLAASRMASEIGDDSHHPSTPVERMIAEIWCSVLKLDHVGVDDNFFDVGGNSARLIQVHQAIETRSRRRVPIVTLFQRTTIRALSEWLAIPSPTTASVSDEASQRRSAGQQKLATWRRRHVAARRSEAERG
ncbi:non-ribosomal peptide synthetase [Bradyrhizobium sp. CB1015]|uniref:non-ribosomal peptide synthetase n=1 Tax=Bradyrhizobium sp. CB1015 TaxID=2976822 RepID=UPI0021AB06ED|nr:non-ribosomal peptide synthetase [Bradyrhizobium sp. CB1015]UWU92926.1 amino acid adenylation domain-containing protein [Bradyrhizobium sp. CB1015]